MGAAKVDRSVLSLHTRIDPRSGLYLGRMEVLLFGMIAEAAGTDRIELTASSTQELREVLVDRVPDIRGLSYSIAVDRSLVHEDITLSGNEEIAVLPPFAGG